MRNIVSDPCETPNENFDFVEHSIHKGRQFIERVIRSSRGQPFPQFAIHDALDEATRRRLKQVIDKAAREGR